MTPTVLRDAGRQGLALVRASREAWRGFTTNSLAFRLLAAAAAWVLLVLPLTGIVLNALYRAEVEYGFHDRLELAMAALTASSYEATANQPVPPRDFGAEEFKLPLSGWYWQIEPADGKPGARIVSPSLLDGRLVFPIDRARPGNNPKYLVADGTGPDGQPIRMLYREIIFGTGAEARRFGYIVSTLTSTIDLRVRDFRNRLALALSVLGIGLVAATLFQVRYGLKPLGKIEQGLADIRSGKAIRLEGELPSEIIPLQRELNALIKSNQDIIERARTHVGNLAHALKTPISVLNNEAQKDPSPLARKVIEQTGIMRDQVNHHLDRARMVARVGVVAGVTEIEPVCEALVRTLQRIYGERGIDVRHDCMPGLRFQGERQDFEEMLGNLLDNACKWASSKVRLTVRQEGPTKGPRQLVCTVEDDGPGLSAEQRAQAIKRGRRLDETKPGSGLGLSIVADLVGLYGGTFALDRSGMGGLKAVLTLPAA